jgi:GGDEF domain-containing protein
MLHAAPFAMVTCSLESAATNSPCSCEAQAAVRRLRTRFEAKTAPLGVSFSAGIALAGEGEAAEDLLARADGAMYREKRGRSERPAAPR